MYRMIPCLFKVPSCFEAAFAKDFAKAPCKSALPRARKSINKNKFHGSEWYFAGADALSGLELRTAARGR
ncbi:hypothetical protein D3C72_2178230 [compost metagenome]